MNKDHETPKKPLKAIKGYCLHQCCAYEPGDNPEGRQLWRNCQRETCPLHSLRFGHYPKCRRVSALKRIRDFCKLDCCNYREAGDFDEYQAWRECDIESCPLHAFRTGENPYRKPQVSEGFAIVATVDDGDVAEGGEDSRT